MSVNNIDMRIKQYHNRTEEIHTPSSDAALSGKYPLFCYAPVREAHGLLRSSIV